MHEIATSIMQGVKVKGAQKEGIDRKSRLHSVFSVSFVDSIIWVQRQFFY